jgi:hypothetical protein
MSAVELDATAQGWLDVYQDLGRQVREVEDAREVARLRVLEALGQADEGLIDGKPAIRRTRNGLRTVGSHEPIASWRMPLGQAGAIA